MPIYEYQHLVEGRLWGEVFEVEQSIYDKPLTHCPGCGGAVRRIISRTYAHTPKTNSELRDIGFTKLVRRDDGVYENVTARDGESKVMHRDRPETYPNLKKTITD
jgi:predicted nucleic acid-binding Zn ribbon protein